MWLAYFLPRSGQQCCCCCMKKKKLKPQLLCVKETRGVVVENGKYTQQHTMCVHYKEKCAILGELVMMMMMMAMNIISVNNNSALVLL